MGKYPDLNVVRYATHYCLNGKSWGVALDIGSGGGANADALRALGWAVITIDNDPQAKAQIRKDVREFAMPKEFFGLILDCNTLCHVENAPYQAIYNGLEFGGLFLSIHPTLDTYRGIADGRFTRFASEYTMRDSLSMFDPQKVEIGYAEYPDPRRRAQIKSWVIKAEK